MNEYMGDPIREMRPGDPIPTDLSGPFAVLVTPALADYFLTLNKVNRSMKTKIAQMAAKFAAAMAPGLGKELTDDKFSTKDLVWDAIGAYAGIKVTGWVIRRNFIGYRSEF